MYEIYCRILSDENIYIFRTRSSSVSLLDCIYIHQKQYQTMKVRFPDWISLHIATKQKIQRWVCNLLDRQFPKLSVTHFSVSNV